MKKVGIIIAAVVVIFVLLSGMKNMIVKIGVEKGVDVVTGLRLKIGSLNIGLLKTLVGIKEIRLYNPEGFDDKIMVDMPEVYVDYDLPAIMKGNVHLYDMKLNLKECFVIKNKDGRLNLDSLKTIQDMGGKKAVTKKTKEAKGDFQIDQLELKIGRVVFKDYSQGVTPHVLQFNVNIDEKYTNITDPNALVGLIVMKVMMNTTIGKLIKLDLTGLQDTVGNTLSSAQHIVGNTTSSATKVVSDAGKTLTNTAGSLTDKLKLPFGGK